jgi:hypothetical protein
MKGGGEVNRGWSCGVSGDDNTQKCTIDLMCVKCRKWHKWPIVEFGLGALDHFKR